MQKTHQKSLVCAFAAQACASLVAAPKLSPETSSLFVDFVDPDGGVPGGSARGVREAGEVI